MAIIGRVYSFQQAKDLERREDTNTALASGTESSTPLGTIGQDLTNAIIKPDLVLNSLVVAREDEKKTEEDEDPPTHHYSKDPTSQNAKNMYKN